MKSFYLFIEVSGLQQFLAVKDSAVSEFMRDCGRIINNVKKSEMIVHDSFIIFQIESEIESSRAVLESALKVLGNMNALSEELHEFSMMLIYRDSSDAERLIGKFKQDYFIRCVDSAIIIENLIIESAGMDSVKEEQPGFCILYSEEPQAPGSNGIYDEYLVEQEEVVRLIEIIIPEFGAETRNTRIILTGKSDIVLFSVFDAAIKKIGGEAGAVVINFLEGESGTIMPFYRSIDPDFVLRAGEYLSGIELKSWNNRFGILSNINSDYPEESFFISYCLYLKARLNAFKEDLLPEIILFDGLAFASVEIMSYLGRILDYLSAESKPVLIFFENETFPIRSEIRSHEIFSGAVEFNCCPDIRMPRDSSNMKYVLKRLLFTISLTEGLFDRSVLRRFLEGFGYDRMEIQTGLGRLAKTGYIRDGRYLHILKSRICKEIINEITDRGDVYTAVAAFVNENIYKLNSFDYALVVERLMSQLCDNEVASAVYVCLSRILDYGGSGKVSNYLSRCKGLPQNMLSSLTLRAALISGDKGSCKELLQNFPEKPEPPEDLSSTAVLLETSRYFHALNDYPRALDCVKKALIFLQEEDYPGIEGTAFIELGFIMLCKGKLLESSEYMSLAVDKLLHSGDEFNLMKAYIFSALGQYLWGSIDSALDFTDKAALKAADGNFENWHFFIDFFKCRLFFELGRYYDAEKLLSGCLLRNEIYPDEKRRRLFLAWTARACVYQGKVYRGLAILKSLKEDPEVLMFIAEAYFFHGDLEPAVQSAKKAGSMTEYFTPAFIPLENINWDNGFVSVEDRALRSAEGTGVMLHLARAFHAYFLGLSGDKEGGIEIIFALTRDQKISEVDPFNRLYFYFFCILYDKSSNADIVDKLTLISKALKYLQQTLSRITTPAVRQEFMMKNYWNSKLVGEARNEKLI
ncbi:MAG: hypothetical protein JEZ04_08915 [Spirochaetales bacterium]|nr:hypothetical protein [Spirochaetales bacterium]